MSADEEYNALKRKASKLKNDMNSCKTRIENCDSMLRRLRPVKDELTSIKADFGRVRKTDDNIGKEDSLWKGETLQSFRARMSDVSWENRDYHINTLDYYLDALNDKITEIENRKLKEYGLLGELSASFNWVANKIENFFN